MTSRQGPSGPLVERFSQYATSEGFDDEETAQKEYASPQPGGEAAFIPAGSNGTIIQAARVPAKGIVRELVVRQLVLGDTPESLDITYTVQVLRADDLLTLVPTGIEVVIPGNDTDEAKSRLVTGFAVAEGDYVLVEADHPAFSTDGAPKISKFTVTLATTQGG
jgi:hypothetical protein